MVDVEPFETIPQTLTRTLEEGGGTLSLEESRLTFEISPSQLPGPKLIDLVSSSFVIRDLFVSALAGIGTQIFFGLINVMVLSAFYSS